MPRYRALGVHRQSKTDFYIDVDADTPANAAVKAELMDVIVTDVQDAHGRSTRAPMPLPMRMQHVVIEAAPQRKWSPGVAIVLSFFIPGLGQMYKGQILNGIVWFCAVVIGYVMLLIPGLALQDVAVVVAPFGWWKRTGIEPAGAIVR